MYENFKKINSTNGSPENYDWRKGLEPFYLV